MKRLLLLLLLLCAVPAYAQTIGNAKFNCVLIGGGTDASDSDCIAYDTTENVIFYDEDCQCDVDAGTDFPFSIAYVHATDCTSLTCDSSVDGQGCFEIDADVFYVCDGGEGVWKNVTLGSSGGANYSQSFTSQTSVTLTHNLGTENLIIMCYDGSDQWIGPNDMTIGASDPFNVTVTFTESQSGRCVVNGFTGGGAQIPNYTQSFSGVTNVVLTHGLGTPNVLTQCFDSGDQQIGVDDLTIAGSTPWAITVNFESAQTGRCVVNGYGGGGRYVADVSATTSITITGATHGLGTQYLEVTCYDDSSPREEVEPDKVTVNDSNNNVIITFAEAETGKCVLQ